MRHHSTPQGRTGIGRRRRWGTAGLAVVACLTVLATLAGAARIFYHAKDWLGTSPETQLRLLRGTLRAWEEVAEAAEGWDHPLSAREREALRLVECIRLRPGLTLEAVRQVIQTYAGEHPAGVFSTFGDLAARALEGPCRVPETR
jgi:hypothetical protein